MGEDGATPVRHVYAAVTLRDMQQQEAVVEQSRDTLGPEEYARWMAHLRSPARISLLVGLSAEDSAGRLIEAGTAFAMGGHEARSDIEDRVNQMLGRDPRLHRPPRLSWDGLIAALGSAGIDVTEEQLIETPMTVELDSEVEAALDAP
ncbi:MAG: hypothetical protein JWN10_879 [Solirubrobacterales bacterium]|nr:hypothetical protein [Solirubrobacterales bacterium]